MNDFANQLPSLDATAALQSFIAFGVVIACVALCGFAGLRLRLFATIMAFGAMIAASVAAYVWGEPCGWLLGGFGFPADWRLVAGFALVFLSGFVLIKVLFRFAVRAEIMTYPWIPDRLGGLLVGILAGLFLASILRVGLAMAPVSARVRPTPEQIQADLTPRVLLMLSRIMSGDPASRRRWLRGPETPPHEGGPAPGKVVISEPFVDENDNGLRDRDEPFLDKDGDGEFSPSFAVIDESLNPDFLVGMIERYWLGNWQRVRVEVR
jgi:hypothetical protein